MILIFFSYNFFMVTFGSFIDLVKSIITDVLKPKSLASQAE